MSGIIQMTEASTTNIGREIMLSETRMRNDCERMGRIRGEGLSSSGIIGEAARSFREITRMIRENSL